MLRSHFFALLTGLLLLAAGLVIGHQMFGDPTESAPIESVEQELLPTPGPKPTFA